MSGRKYSEIALTASIRDAISCRVAATQAYARAESLVFSLAEGAVTTPALKPLADSARETLAQIKRQLESSSQTQDQRRLASLTLTQVQAERQNVQHLKEQLEQIDAKCRAGNNAASMRSRLLTVLNLLAQKHDEIEPWLRDVYSSFSAECRSLLARVDDQIKRTGSIGPLTDEIDTRVRQFDEHMDQVSERQTRDAERRYVASALEKVCKSIAFTVTLLPQNGPLEDLVLAVDTHSYGVIRFTLKPDGKIESNSQLMESSCCVNFTMIEDKLRNFGVLSEFRYEDQVPVRMRKGEKDLPQPAAGRTRHQGG
jgi:hypothetical protein